ncbi:MAG: PotD/PotF family extracellular solute-binding protein [Alphaproteobacteria bacterium]
MTSRMTRREFVGTFGATVAAALAVEMGGAAPAFAEDRMTVSLTGGVFGQTLRRFFVQEPGLEKEIGSSVAFDDSAIQGVRAAKTIAKCGNPDFTCVQLQNVEAVQLAEGGCIQGYDLGVVTNYGDLFPITREPPRPGMEAFFGGALMFIAGAVWNTKHATKPEKWHDLLASKYKGKVGIPSAAWFGQSWLNAVNIALGGNEASYEPAFAFLTELKKNNPVIMASPDLAVRAFEREEIVIAPFWNGRCFKMQETGVPVQIAYLPGTLQVADGFVIAKGTKFTAGANRLVNNSFDPALQLKVSRALGYPPSNAKAVLPADIAHYAVPTEAMANLVRLDSAMVSRHRDAFADRWNRILFG